MQSEFTPPLTRLDAVLWFLRVQMWVSVIALILAFIQPYPLSFSLGSILQNGIGNGISVLVLLIFPGVLANSALGTSAREPLNSLLGLRSLVIRCVGLSLFVGNLGWAFIYSAYVLYSLVPNVSSAWAFGSGVGLSYMRFQIGVTALRFILGFFLAFGPAIRDNFRAR